METGDGLIKNLGENVDTNVEGTRLGELNVLASELLILGLVKSDLSKNLVGERAGHDERRVTSGTAKVDKTTLSEEDDVSAVLQKVTVNLGLNVDNGLGRGLQPSNVNLNVKVTNVADNSIVGHDREVLTSDDITATGGGDKDLTDLGSLLHGENLVTRDSSLESVDGINLSDKDTSTHALESKSTTLTDITESGNNGGLTGNHNIGGTLDTIDKRLTAAVKVIELGLGNGIVNVDGRDLKLALLEHAVKVVDTSGGLLGKTVTVLQKLGVLLVDESGKITTIIEDKVELLAILESVELLLNAPDVLLLGLTLPGEDRDASSGNSSGSVVLGGENVAGRPGNLSTESNEGLNEDGSLDGHVETTSNAGTSQGLLSSVLGTGLHQTGHLVLGELDFLSTEGSKTDISNFVVNGAHF